MAEISTFGICAEEEEAHGVLCPNRQTCLCSELFLSSIIYPRLTLLTVRKAVCEFRLSLMLK